MGDTEDCDRRLVCLMRVYIPATLAMLQQLVADGSLRPVSGTAFAVTPTLRESYAEGDDDELAEVALREAALASLRLLAGDGRRSGRRLPPRRAVLVADVPTVRHARDPISTTRWCGRRAGRDRATWSPSTSTTPPPNPLCGRRSRSIDDADLGDEDAELTVGDAQDHDLAWYAAAGAAVPARTAVIGPGYGP